MASPLTWSRALLRAFLGNGGLSLSRPANAAVRPVASGPHARKIQNRNGCFTSRFSFSALLCAALRLRLVSVLYR
ncbi:hypothetical protein EDB89DRAFT_1958579 [Lactarius sanguifluus]|nr:hypothetical protein EDB89DRAFT_1958579 [Lactarius sanguifluus]